VLSDVETFQLNLSDNTVIRINVYAIMISVRPLLSGLHEERPVPFARRPKGSRGRARLAGEEAEVRNKRSRISPRCQVSFD
jgi:hypothetical protein